MRLGSEYEEDLYGGIQQILAKPRPKLRHLAALIKTSLDARWVWLYEVDAPHGLVRILTFAGPCAPAFPEFPIQQGLTAAAVGDRRTVNVGDVTQDQRYLTAFGSTRSEIIVPILDAQRERVIGTIDVESEYTNAFNPETQHALEKCAELVSALFATRKH